MSELALRDNGDQLPVVAVSAGTRPTDSGALRIVDAASSDSKIVGPDRVEPGEATKYSIVVSPAGADGTAVVRIDGLVLATSVSIADVEGRLALTFPPAAPTERNVTVELTPANPRAVLPRPVLPLATRL